MRAGKQVFAHRFHVIVMLGLAGILSPVSTAAESDSAMPRDAAREILDKTGIQGGLIVHVGCGDGKLTAALRASDRYRVHGLDTNPRSIEKARTHIQSLGLYGNVSVDRFDGHRLPYTDNLVNLVVSEDLGKIAMDEVMRVLAPEGVAYVKKEGTWTKTVKPRPADIDEWTHYLHGADGNPVAQDRVVGPPKHYQWVAGPLWMRSHESDASVRTLVTAGGKLFYIGDEGPISLPGDHSLPDKWFLTARDAFNGILLWQVPIKDWGWQAWKPSWFTPRPGDIPLNIQKRLVAVGDRIYVTLGYRAPVSELDAQTGKVLKTYDGTDRTSEILYHGGVLILTLVGSNDRDRVIAVDAKSGKRLWASKNDYGGTKTDYYRFSAMRGSVTPAKIDPTLNTATDGRVVALLDGADVVGLDFKTGQQRWRTPFPLVEADHNAGRIKAGQTVWTGTLIVLDGVVVHASPNQLAAFSAESGKMLWKQPKQYLQHLWFEWKDVFVIDGLVWTWSAELKRGKLQGGGNSAWPATVNGYDLHTGELVKKVPLGNIFKTHHHHRCYRNKATTRYILASRRGTEFVDLEEGKHSVNNWVRGTCHMGMMPANGLQYAPPHPCVCYMDEKLNSFNALAAARTTKTETENAKKPAARLQRGPAFGHAGGDTAGEGSWPAFRHDAIRSGSVKTKVPATPELLWKQKLGNKVAPAVAVAGRVFVPLVDEHQLVALSASDGKPLWRHTTGGRIDSPPTYYKGTLIFGSADGRVYCVRASDGVLVWRFRAAPEERLIGAFGQLESAWPVHGSVLVLDGTAYFAAGRSSHLDGGIYLFGLDAATGRVRCRAKLEGPSYGVDNIDQNYRLPMGTLPDVLQSDGKLIYMRTSVFDLELKQPENPRPTADRVRPKGSLLDDSYFKRTPWMFGLKSPHARLVVHDDRAAYFLRMFDSLQGLDPKVYFTPGKEGYLLFARDKATRKDTWSRRIPLRINAMAITDGLLFVAGSPDVVDPKDPLGAFEGRKGGVLAACDVADGKTLWQRKLTSPSVFHGLAAAGGRLFLSTQNGEVVCFGK